MRDYQEVEFPRTRIATLDVCEVGRKKHHMKALLELDVTHARNSIKKYRSETGEKLSFTAWLIKTISKTIEQHQSTHAYLKNKRKSVIFNDIDISITVERKYQGELVPLPYVIRETNKKDFLEITNEIYNAKNQQISEEDIVLGQKRRDFSTQFYYFLPAFLRRLIWKFILSHPQFARKNMGSVMITSIAMMGRVNGWFIHTSVHPLSFGISSVVKTAAVIKDKIEIREVLKMTVLLDHDVVDGAPMARFISKLSENIETGLGLQNTPE